MMEDLSDVVALLSSGSYTVTRYTADSYDSNGIAVQGTSSTLSIGASVQPASGRDLQLLPEGRRTIETMKLWTATLLTTSESSAGADRISIDGATFEVVNVERWGPLGNYTKALVQKVTDR